MMRLNAPLTALLALAVLFLIPATLLAKPAHRRAHKTVTHKQTHKAAKHPSNTHLKPTHTTSTRATSRHTTTRVSSHRPRTSRHLSRTKAETRRSASARVEASNDAPKKATAADFVKAAAAQPGDHKISASHDTERASSRRSAVAEATPVVNIIRPTTDKPQLKSVEEDAATPLILPTLYNKRGRLIIPPPLKGSHEILLHQNEVADREGLDRIQNDADLLDMRNKKMLVPLPASYALEVDDRLPENRRYCRPWTSQFLANMARAHYAHFHSPLQINSAVRTAEFQHHLIRINGNAAPAEGDTASPHLTGQAVDIAKHGLSRTEVAWMRGYLLPLIQEGKIDVEEEFQQSCFHISVYKKYLPPADMPRRDLANHRRGEASALAAAIH
jgi:hypothetical protein